MEAAPNLMDNHVNHVDLWPHWQLPNSQITQCHGCHWAESLSLVSVCVGTVTAAVCSTAALQHWRAPHIIILFSINPPECEHNFPTEITEHFIEHK